MSVFLPDDKADLIDQLNALNDGAPITADDVDVTLNTDGTGQVLAGEGDYMGTVDTEYPIRSFARLFPATALIKTTLTASMTGADALALLNSTYHLNIPSEYITSQSLAQRPSYDGVKMCSMQFKMTPTPDNPYWKDVFYISLFDKYPEEMTPQIVSSTDSVDRIKALPVANGGYQQHHISASDKVFTPGPIEYSNGMSNWFMLLSFELMDGYSNVQLDWSNFIALEGNYPTFPSVEVGTKQYFIVYTLSSGTQWYVKQLTEEEATTNPLQVGVNWVPNAGVNEKLMEAHNRFLDRNTGEIVDPHTDHYVFNAQGVLLNNRHFTYDTRQEGQPDSDATTEGQSLFILGSAIYGDAVSVSNVTLSGNILDKSKAAFDAYVMAFYAELEPPTVPGRWISNWIVNGKAPVLAHYPLADNDFPTHGGFMATEIEFVNGVGQLPHGSPDFGEYTDLLCQVYEGVLGWPNLTATVYKLNEDGSTNWDEEGTVYPYSQVGLWTLKFADADGNLLGDCTADQVGQITLTDTSVNATLKVSWAPRVPVEDGGYLIATNECQHNRPIQVPVSREYMGNASDAEQWFCEGAWSLWQLSKEDRYLQAFEASRFTIKEYTLIDANDMFFRQVTGTDRFDTDGISYNYTYPSDTPITVTRNAAGYIQTHSDVAVQVFYEQNALPFRVTRDSILRVTYGGTDSAANYINFSTKLTLSIDKSEEKGVVYGLDLPVSKDVVTLDIPIGSMVPADNADVASTPQTPIVNGLAPYEVPTEKNIDYTSAATVDIAARGMSDEAGNGRAATTMLATATGSGMQVDIKMKVPAPIKQIKYRASIDFNIRVSDANGWRWWAMLPATLDWPMLDLSDASKWSLSSYQPDGTGTAPTTFDTTFAVTEYSLLPDSDSVAGDYIEVYCVNAEPPESAETGGTVTEDPVSGSMLLTKNNVTWSAASQLTMVLADDLPSGRTATVLSCKATDSGQQIEFSASAPQVVRQVIYKSDIAFNVRVDDLDGWRWWAMMPASVEWRTQQFLIADWSLSSYQPNHDGETTQPEFPNFGEGTTDITFLPDDDSVAGNVVTLYCVNQMPEAYNVDDGYTILFQIEADMDTGGNFYLGDCTILNQRQDPLPYTPGVIPFSNNYVPNAPTFDGWHGQPYPGYQHPWVFLDIDDDNRELMIQNVVDFWVDSQAWYHTKFGIWGPGASAYTWDRWDAPAGATVNDFTMYNFGDQDAWSGYQPRAFFSAVRLYAGHKERSRALPTGLETYISNWIDYLYQFMIDNDGVSPTEFPMETIPVAVPDDFTGHMCGLWLAGASLAMLHTFPNTKGYPLAQLLYAELRTNMVNNYLVDDVMNGGWSSWGDPADLGKDGLFYGFWSGEIQRGLGYYHSLAAGTRPSLVVGAEYDLSKLPNVMGITTNAHYMPEYPDGIGSTHPPSSFSVATSAVNFVIPAGIYALLSNPGSIIDAADVNEDVDALLQQITDYYGSTFSLDIVKAAFGKRKVVSSTINGDKFRYQYALLLAEETPDESVLIGDVIIGVNTLNGY